MFCCQFLSWQQYFRLPKIVINKFETSAEELRGSEIKENFKKQRFEIRNKRAKELV